MYSAYVELAVTMILIARKSYNEDSSVITSWQIAHKH